jgi:hypothetical protein
MASCDFSGQCQSNQIQTFTSQSFSTHLSRASILRAALNGSATGSEENSHGSACRMGRGIERDIDLCAAEPQTDLPRQVLVRPTTRRRKVREARALCPIGSVRDRAARNLGSSLPGRRRSPGVCIAARHAKAALDTAPNKTGGNRRRWRNSLVRLRRIPPASFEMRATLAP